MAFQIIHFVIAQTLASSLLAEGGTGEGGGGEGFGGGEGEGEGEGG